MGFASRHDLLPSSGYIRSGIGPALFVGRDRRLALTLDVSDADPITSVDVCIETAASHLAEAWRSLGAFPQVTTAGLSTLTVDGADAFVRARWGIVAPPGVQAVGMSLVGAASLVLAPPAARDGAGSLAPVNLAQYHGARLALLVTAAPAGETLTVTVERSGDGQAWVPAAAFEVMAGIGETAIASADLDAYVRVSWVASGGSWTFGVAGTSHLIYARVRDRAMLGIRRAAIPDTTPDQYLDALLTATGDVAAYLNRYDHPLMKWGHDIASRTIAFADVHLLRSRGEEPGASNIYGAAKADAEAWLAAVAGLGDSKRTLAPVGIVDSAPANAQGEVKRWYFVSDPPRGFGRNGFAGGI